MKTFEANLTQFIRPDARQVAVACDLPIEVEPLYQQMLNDGCRLECEVLRTGEVSVTVSDGDNDIDFSITPNTPLVHNGIVDMLKRQSWLKLKQVKESL